MGIIRIPTESTDSINSPFKSALISFLLIAGCSGGGSGGSSTSGPGAPPSQVIATGGVTPQGGGVISGQTSDGQIVTIDVPSGAVAKKVDVTVAQESNVSIPQEFGEPVGKPFSVTGTVTEFAQPVTIKLPFDPNKLPAGIQTANLAVAALHNGEWTILANGSVDTRHQTVQAQTMHFSIHQVVLCLSPQCIPGSLLISPVEGATLHVSDSTDKPMPNANDPNDWDFWQRKTDGHSRFGGLCKASDTYAWDINLPGNGDKGKKVFAVADGWVADAFNGLPNPWDLYGAVLIRHYDSQIGTWYSGYLHMREIPSTIRPGMPVTTSTTLGVISNKHVPCSLNCTDVPKEGCGPDDNSCPHHLHFVVYRGANQKSDCTEKDDSKGLASLDLIPHDLSTICRRTSPLPCRPSPPTLHLNTAVTTPLRIDLQWTPGNNNEEVFELFRQSGQGPFQLLQILPKTALSYRDTQIISGADYAYKIRARNGTGASAFSNPVRAIPGTVVSADLELTTVNFPSSAGRGDIIQLSAGVANQGSKLSPVSSVEFYLSQDQNISAQDMKLGECLIPALDPGAKTTCNPIRATIPALTPGAYFIGGIANADDRVPETIRSNNAIVSGTLEVTSFGGSGSVDVMARLNGVEVVAVPSGCISDVRLTGPAFDNEICLGNFGLPLSNQGAGMWTVNYVSGGPPNSSFTGFTPSNHQTLVGGGTITFTVNFVSVGEPRPDLVAWTANGPDQAIRGTTVNLSENVEVFNQGNITASSFRIGFYWSKDQTFSDDDVFAGSCTISGLAAPQFARCGIEGPSVNLNVPSSLAPGRYFLITYVDDLDQISELDGANNFKADQFGTNIN